MRIRTFPLPVRAGWPTIRFRAKSFALAWLLWRSSWSVPANARPDSARGVNFLQSHVHMCIVKLGCKYSERTRNLSTFAAFSTHQARELAELEVRDVEFKNFLDMTLSKLLELHGSCVKCCLDGANVQLICMATTSRQSAVSTKGADGLPSGLFRTHDVLQPAGRRMEAARQSQDCPTRRAS